LQWVLLDEFRRAGVAVVFVNQPSGMDQPHEQLLLGMQGLFAEYERMVITERLRRGKLYRVRQGGLVPPMPPYGYHYIPVTQPNGGRWELDPGEARVVERIYEWYTETEGITITQIVARLNQDPATSSRYQRPWAYSTVQAILSQVAYTGRVSYNRTRRIPESVGGSKQQGRGRRRDPLRQQRNPQDWIEMSVPVLIPSERWQQAQERLRMNQKFASRNNTQHFYLLRGLLVCSVCGRTLVGQGQRYRCNNGGKARPPEVPAHRLSVPTAQIEQLVWQEIIHLLHHPRLMMDAWHATEPAGSPTLAEAQRLRARQLTLDRQWQRLLDAYQNEVIPQEELAKRKPRFDQERQSLTDRLHQIERQSNDAIIKEQVLQDFETFCQHVHVGLETATPQIKQEVLRLLIDQVIVSETEITIKHIIPSDDDIRLLPPHTGGVSVGSRGFIRQANKAWTNADRKRDSSLYSSHSSLVPVLLRIPWEPRNPVFLLPAQDLT
jgi:site-specific DNA recombinase